MRDFPVTAVHARALISRQGAWLSSHSCDCTCSTKIGGAAPRLSIFRHLFGVLFFGSVFFGSCLEGAMEKRRDGGHALSGSRPQGGIAIRISEWSWR